MAGHPAGMRICNEFVSIRGVGEYRSSMGREMKGVRQTTYQDSFVSLLWWNIPYPDGRRCERGPRSLSRPPPFLQQPAGVSPNASQNWYGCERGGSGRWLDEAVGIEAGGLASPTALGRPKGPP